MITCCLAKQFTALRPRRGEGISYARYRARPQQLSFEGDDDDYDLDRVESKEVRIDRETFITQMNKAKARSLQFLKSRLHCLS